ncbi:hypothetical protein [Rhodoplanes azumiensis]|uniref:Helix-turn-helix domain-containing protein n=1 Tax=Rhodoplanes azumiensis TaxID=1897628 RepID=A0ABW5AKX2_9BRAD
MADPRLPGILAEIAEVAGVDTALAIAKAKGGRRASFPVQADDDHWLVKTVGREAADAICKHFRIMSASGRLSSCFSDVPIPKGYTAIIAVARARLEEALAEGKSASEAARISGMTERTVFRARARLSGRTKSK